MPTQLCLYCFEEFDPWKMLVRCRADDAATCGQHIDAEYDAYWGYEGSSSVKRGRLSKIPDPGIMKALHRIKRQYPCETCNTSSDLLCCPHCHNQLPHPLDRKEEIIISLIGGPASGKTVYLGLLLDEFNKVMGPRYGLRPLTEEVTKRYQRVYRDPINQLKLPGATQKATMDPEARHPLLFSLGEVDSQSWTVVLHDTAGEHFTRQKDLRRFNRYLVHCDGAIVFVDPENMAKVRKRLTNTPKGKISYRAIDLLNSVHDLIVKELDLGGRLVELPLAIALNKIDLLSDSAAMSNAPLITQGFRVLEPSEHGPEFHEAHALEVHDEMSSLLIHLGEDDLINNSRLMFSRSMSFGISPLGKPPNPKDNSLSTEPDPHRLLDPFLWILAQLHCIEYIE